MSLYNRFLHELASVSTTAPKLKAPKQLNQHLLLDGPFDSKKLFLDQMSKISVQKKSEEYFKTTQLRSEPHELGMPYLTDIPIPKCLQKHIEKPSFSLSNQTGVNRVLGFQIQLKGRRGLRTMKSAFTHGRLDRNNVGNGYVDSAKAHFVSKRGVSSIKVWVNYGK